MRRPGRTLRAMVARVFDARTMARVIDPIVADLQAEYTEAIRRGRRWGSCWILVVGYAAFFKVIAWCGIRGLAHPLAGWTTDDRRGFGRTLGVAAAAIVAATILLELQPMVAYVGMRFGPGVNGRLLVYLTPQALVVAVPLGFTLGVLVGLRGRVVSRQLTAAVVAIAMLCGAVSLVTVAWILPAANQAFRVQVMGGDPPPGAPELTLAELRQALELGTHEPMRIAPPSDQRLLAFNYYLRWSLSFATLVLTLFALAVVTRRHMARWIVAVAALGVCVGYYVLMWVGRATTLHLPAFVGAWLPNIVFALVTVVLLTMASPQSRRAQSTR